MELPDIFLKNDKKIKKDAIPGFNYLAIQAMQAGVIVIDSHGMIKLLNPRAEEILEVEKKEVIDHHISSKFPQSTLIEMLSKGRPKITRLMPGYSEVIAAQAPIKYHDKIHGAVSIFLKSSKIRELTSELEVFKELAGELSAIFDNSYDGIYITDGKGETLRMNNAYERITGLKADSLVGKNMQDIVKQGLISESITFKIQKTRKPMTITQKIQGGKEILVSGVPVFNKNDELYRVITSVRDMTELNNFRKQLSQTKELASRYEHELDELRANQMDHVNIISSSKQMTEILELAMRVAKVNSSVLIQGESGVGKEIVANLIHKHSPRAKTGSFIKINCGAIPNELLESELFGYEEGAFTGAKKQGKPGMFELSDNGTLFLDEIGSISISLQVKLLRVLQFREIMRLGATKSKKINIRIVAAASQDLKELIKKGRFREDLFYRLHVVPIKICPLRERKDDIVPLIIYYLDQFNKEFGFTKRFSKESLECLNAYHWPGNVRELKNLMERLVVTTMDDIIEIEDLPSSIKDQNHFNNFLSNISENKSLKETLDMIEKKCLLQAFAAHKTTRKVANALKISQSAVMRKVQKHQLKFKQDWDH